MNPKPCHQCGQTFTPGSGRAKYCPTCRHQIAATQKQSSHYRRNILNQPPQQHQPNKAARRNVVLRPGYDDNVLAQCWCQYTYIEIPAATIRNGRTGTCGLPHCTPPTERPTGETP